MKGSEKQRHCNEMSRYTGQCKGGAGIRTDSAKRRHGQATNSLAQALLGIAGEIQPKAKYGAEIASYELRSAKSFVPKRWQGDALFRNARERQSIVKFRNICSGKAKQNIGLCCNGDGTFTLTLFDRGKANRGTVS